MGQLNEVIHQPVRLRIMATLAALERDSELHFVYLRDLLKVTGTEIWEPHLAKLEETGYVRSIKKFVSFASREPIRPVDGQWTPRIRGACGGFASHPGSKKLIEVFNRSVEIILRE